MLSVRVDRWWAWAPGLEDQAAWKRWCRQPQALSCDGSPDVRFLPPLLRRRCGRLSRMMLKVAFGCGGPSLLLDIPTVFASRHGDTTTTIELLECLASKTPVSANQFSHSVHNTQAGLFTIATGNRRPASALAAGRDTLGCSFLESLGVLLRLGGEAVLLVIADEPLPPVLSPFVDEPQAAYAVAFLLEPHDGPGAITLSLGDDPDSGHLPVAVPWPQPVEFLRFLVSGEPTITLPSPACRWTWRRADQR